MGRKSRILTDEDKKEIGLYCCNCGSTEDLEYHHIVPLVVGGKDINSNICCVCYSCHQLIHFGKRKVINHSKLTKEGIETARLNGKQIGRKTGVQVITKKSIECKKQILKYSKSFNGSLSDIEVMKLTGLARNTYYKYKKELKGVQ